MEANLQNSIKQTKLSDFFYKDNSNAQFEICLILFSHCNLHCSFCFQSQKANEIDIGYIENIPTKIYPQLVELVNNKNITSIVYRIWGGEVFSDYLPDSIFCTYKKLIDGLSQIGNKLNVKSEFCFSSNLTFTKVGRVEDFLNNNNVYLATSYDPIGRFQTQGQIIQWQHNVQKFKPICVSITLTQQNIEKFISEPEHFERLKNQSVYIEYYIYCKNYKIYAPSQDNIYKFFKYCIDNKIFNISEIYKIFNKKGRYCSCNNSCYFKNGKLLFDCIARSSDLPLSDFDIIDNSVDGRLQATLKKHNCMLCKHFPYCRMYCIASMLHKDFSLENCALARIYDYLENGRVHNLFKAH